MQVPSTSMEKENMDVTEEDAQLIAHDPLALDDRNIRYVECLYFMVPVFFIYAVTFGSVLQSSDLLFVRSSSDECFIKPCSSKATSVIRLACQKTPKPSTSASSTPLSSLTSTSQTKGESTRSTTRQSVKKLVLKLKKPFVPVIEEEANLHPPGKSSSLYASVEKFIVGNRVFFWPF